MGQWDETGIKFHYSPLNTGQKKNIKINIPDYPIGGVFNFPIWNAFSTFGYSPHLMDIH